MGPSKTFEYLFKRFNYLVLDWVRPYESINTAAVIVPIGSSTALRSLGGAEKG